MSTRRQWLLILLIAGLGAIAGYRLRQPSECKASILQAAISNRAAELCTGQLVGCGMTYEQVRQVVAEQVEAEQCK